MRKEVKEEEEESTDPSKGVCYSEAEFEKVASIVRRLLPSLLFGNLLLCACALT